MKIIDNALTYCTLILKFPSVLFFLNKLVFSRIWQWKQLHLKPCMLFKLYHVTLSQLPNKCMSQNLWAGCCSTETETQLAEILYVNISNVNQVRSFTIFAVPHLLGMPATGITTTSPLFYETSLFVQLSLTTRSVALPGNCPNGLRTCWVGAGNESFSLRAGRVSASGRCWQAADV